MANHIKTSMLIMERTGMLYILKLVCLRQKNGENGYVVQLKLACLLQNNGKNGYVVRIKTSMFTTEKREKTGMLYIFKIVR